MKYFITTFIFFTILFSTLSAGEWHIGPSSDCDDCHLQHSSEQGQQLPGGPYTYLLLKNSINELCLSCHDGSNPTAPDVLTPVDMYNTTESKESGAGWFAPAGENNIHGHSLGLSLLTPLQNSAKITELNCASCHAVHGNGNYRNLLYDPAGRGDSIALIDGMDIFTEHPPDKPPTSSGAVIAYNRGNIGYKAKYSRWCAACHDLLNSNNPSTPPAHFNGHPVDVALNEFFSDLHADPGHWTGGLGDGFINTPGATDGILRVPFESALATDFASSKLPQNSDRVFCGSCHKAHGGENQKSVLWPFREGGNNFVAGCQQCHNK